MTLNEFQERVAAWCVECFGKEDAPDVGERSWRFLEEALELFQSLDGTAEDAHKLVDYVFSREVGHPPQELGGTMTTLAALAVASGMSLEDDAVTELERVEHPKCMERIRRKHASKPHRSPLPGDYRY